MLCKTTALTAQLLAGWLPNSIGFEDSQTHPVRCHYELAEDAGRCAIVLEAVEQAWTVQVDTIGFPAPVPDEDGLVDIYLHRDPDGGAYAWCGTNPDIDPEDGRSGCAAIIAIDREIPDKILPWYLAHEFNHVLQWATDFNEGTLPVWEGTATAAEPWTDAAAYRVDKSYVSDFQSTPWLGLLGDGNFLWDEYELWSYYEYGSALWIQYLDHSYGDGQGSGGRDLWLGLAQEGLPNTPDVLDSVDSLSGDWRQALMEFSVLRTRVGTSSAPEWAAYLEEEGGLIPEDQVPFGAIDLQPAVQPYETGAVYWVLTDVPAGQRVALELVSAQEGGDWGLLWASSSDGGWERGAELVFTAPATEDSTLWIGAVNLDHSAYARTANTAALKQGQQSITLRVEEGPPEDTGSPDSGSPDSGSPETDTGEGGDEEGCGGCSGGGGAGTVGLLAGVLLLRRRRQR